MSNFYNFKIKQSGTTQLYTPTNKYSSPLKRSGTGQGFTVSITTLYILREEDGSYLLEEDGSYIFEEN